MKLEKQFTSLKLSKKLKKLGVKQESLFKWHRAATDGRWIITLSDELDEGWEAEELISAFTPAELGEKLPKDLYIPYKGKSGKKRKYPQHPHCFFSTMGCQVNYTGGNSREFLTQTGSTEANARAKMLIYLRENNLLQGGEKNG